VLTTKPLFGFMASKILIGFCVGSFRAGFVLIYFGN